MMDGLIGLRQAYCCRRLAPYPTAPAAVAPRARLYALARLGCPYVPPSPRVEAVCRPRLSL